MMADTAVWLFDRGTTAYRGYARRGDLVTLETAYRETAIYRAGITGTGASTRIPIPAPDDLKYHYTQNMAIHYLLTGDDRFREAAEAVDARAATLWTSPGYAGGDDFWTERHAGFGLLAYVWAMIVSDDAAAEFRGLADTAVTAYLDDAGDVPGRLRRSAGALLRAQRRGARGGLRLLGLQPLDVRASSPTGSTPTRPSAAARRPRRRAPAW